MAAQGLGQADRQRVRFEMVDPDQWQAVGQRDRLGGDEAHDHAADEARAGGRGDGIEIAEARAGLCHRLRDDLVHAFHVGARGDLGHHAAVGPMLFPL